jgi:asparagine synthase (glutamine-hydrolysing)
MFAQTTLPTFLHYSDRNAMAFSIEARVPFLDHRLVEYAFTLPIGEKVHRGQTKYLLRESMKNVLPPKIYERKDKIGFGAPGEVKWLKGPLKDLLDMDLSLMEEVLNIPKTKKLLNQYLMGDYKNATLIWRIAMLHLWMKMNNV